ncbi:MAG: ABC transporter permease subunit, partial [Micromonosporaceae bacterium]
MATAPAGLTGLEREERRFARILVSPALLILAVTTTFPLGYLLFGSLYREDLSSPDGNGFIGLGNYLELLGDPRFWHSLWLSFVYTVASVVSQIVVGMALALLVHRIRHGSWLLRIVAILPILLAPVVVGLVWRTLLLTPNFGIVDYLSETMGFGSHDWLGEPTSALVFTIIMHTWQWTPFCFLVFLASLATLPSELTEAAQLDRASAWNRFWHITFPLLRPAITVVAIIRTVVALSAFDAILAATGGRGVDVIVDQVGGSM